MWKYLLLVIELEKDQSFDVWYLKDHGKGNKSLPTKIKEGFKIEYSVDVNLSCGKIGEDINIISVLNGYLLKETTIKNISKYKTYDRFK